MSGQSGKVFWKSWNVRHFLSNRRVRSWKNGGAGGHPGHIGAALRRFPKECRSLTSGAGA